MAPSDEVQVDKVLEVGLEYMHPEEAVRAEEKYTVVLHIDHKEVLDDSSPEEEAFLFHQEGQVEEAMVLDNIVDLVEVPAHIADLEEVVVVLVHISYLAGIEDPVGNIVYKNE